MLGPEVYLIHYAFPTEKNKDIHRFAIAFSVLFIRSRPNSKRPLVYTELRVML